MDINEKIEALRQEARAEYEAAVKRADAARAAMRTLGIEVDAAPVIEREAAPVIVLESEPTPLFTDAVTHQKRARSTVHPNVTANIMSHLATQGVTPELKLARLAYGAEPRAVDLVRRPINRLISHGFIGRDTAVVEGPSRFVYRITPTGRAWWEAYQRGEATVPWSHKKASRD